MNKYKRIFFTGIKGVGMAALAVIAKQRGLTVAGSDVDEEFPTDPELQKSGITVYAGFLPTHIDAFRPDLVVYTGAHNGADNPQVRHAKNGGIPVLAHGKALGMFMEGYRQISVAGCHGKTTTAGMVATILKIGGMDPSYAIGAPNIRGLGFAGNHGTGDMFVAEADEYVTDPKSDMTPRFLWHTPEVLIVTNIDYDHPDVYKTFSDLKDAYLRLTKNITRDGLIIYSSDDPASNLLSAIQQSVSVGFDRQSSYVIRLQKTGAKLISPDGKEYSLHPRVPGLHNIQNAAMAAVACGHFGVLDKDIDRGLSVFRGAGRRFEILHDGRRLTVIDDYAHHPAEIQATLRAAKEKYPDKRIVAVFQPHTVSRTKALLGQFSGCFSGADSVYILPIFTSARELPDRDFSSHDLVKALQKSAGNVQFAAESDIRKLSGLENSVLVCMGAGDVYRIAHELIKHL